MTSKVVRCNFKSERKLTASHGIVDLLNEWDIMGTLENENRTISGATSKMFTRS